MTQPQLSFDQYLNQRYLLSGRMIDPLTGAVSFEHRSGHMRRKELMVLAVLAAADGKVVTRQTLIDLVWDGNDMTGEAGVTGAISALRRSLFENEGDRPIILTVPRKGYQLAAKPHIVEQDLQAPMRFRPGMEISGKAGWLLERRLVTDESRDSRQQTWVATGPGNQRHLFRFCLEEQHLRALQREITLLRYLKASLAARNDCVAIVDWRLDEPPYYLELPFTQHGNLLEYAAAQGGLAQVSRLDRQRWMAQIARALAVVHGLGIVHGHLDASSVLLDEADGQVVVKLGEFGLSAIGDPARLQALQITALGLTQPGVNQANLATAASDVYHLCVLLYQLWTGDTQITLKAGWQDHVQSSALRALIASGTAEAHEARPSAQAIAKQLDTAILDTQPEAGAYPSATPEVSSFASGPDLTIVNQAPMIGPYRVLDKLGQGGMGVVYLAEQSEPVQRQVAVKVILAGMDTSQVLARFEAERQVLALMNHVNVAAVYDAGSADSGRPYFAMEYVTGLEITAHCDQRELDFKSRIELFLQVCDGVLHAHQKGIIHRDLKPSNLLIKSAQGQPATAKIIDFGVAKSLQRNLGHVAAHTQLGSFVGTPVYSSPEQIAGLQASVDTRADIYSLGVVLYELLSGVTPFSSEVLSQKSPLDISKLLSSEEPPSLLKRFISLTPDAGTEIATRRQMSVTQMRKSLGSDLSWIVAKCLELDPNERYASVLELQKDLRRWIENRPVEARPITWAYRLGKAIKRNRAMVLLGGASAGALLLTTAVAVYGFVRANRALAEAELAAEFQAKQMQTIDPAIMGLGFRESLLDAIRKRDLRQGTAGAAIDANQAHLQQQLEGVNFTDLSVAQIDSYYIKPALTAVNDFGDQPLLQAKLRFGVSAVQRSFGLFDDALKTQTLALSQQRQLLGENALPTIQSLRQRGQILRALNRSKEAESDLRAAVVAANYELGPDQLETIKSANALARVLATSGNPAEAQQILKPLLENSRKFLGSEHPETLRTMGNLAIANFELAQVSEAIAMATEQVQASRRLFGAANRDTLAAASTLATLLSKNHQLKDAETQQMEVLRQYRAVLGDKHPTTVTALMNLAGTLTNQGKFGEAEQLTQEALATSQALRGSDQDASLKIHYNLAVILFRQQRLRDAEQTLRQIVQMRQQVSGEQSPDTVLAKGKLAGVMAAQENYAEALPLLKNILASNITALGPEHKVILEIQTILAYSQTQAGHFEAAHKLYLDTLEAHNHVYGAEDPVTLDISSDFAWLLIRMNRPDEAETRLRQVLAAQRVSKDDDKRSLRVTMSRLISLLREQGKLADALKLGEEMTAADDEAQNDSYQFGLLQLNHAHTLAKLGKYPQAEALYLAAHKNLTRWSEEGHELKELTQAMVDLYAAWNSATPGTQN